MIKRFMGRNSLPTSAVFSLNQFPSLRAHVGAIVGMTNAIQELVSGVTLFVFRHAKSRQSLVGQFGLNEKTNLGWSAKGLSRLSKTLSLIVWLCIAALRRHEIVLTRNALIALFALRSNLVLLEFHQSPTNRLSGMKFDRIILPLLRSNRVKFVVITERLRERIQTNYPHLDASRFVVAPSGFRADWYSPQWEPSPGHGRIAYVGSLYPGRGVEMVIELARQLPDVEVLIAGGSIEQWEELIEQRDVPQNCSYHPHVPAVDVPNLLYSCDVLLAPYQQEALIANGQDIAPWMSPLKLVEYMAAGRAIVASNLPMSRELLTDSVNSILVDPTDTDEWVGAARRLLNDSQERDRLGRAAHTAAHGVLDWDSRLQRILTAFNHGSAVERNA